MVEHFQHLPVRHVPLAPFDSPVSNPRQRSGGSKDDRIVKGQTYLAKVHGRWYLGGFSEQWYGWSFNDWGTSGIQLDSIDDLYEVDLSALDSD